MATEFRYMMSGDGNLQVSIVPDHDGRTVNTISRLAMELKNNIPFQFTTPNNGEPSIRILRGAHEKRILTVQMVVCANGMTRDDAVEQLKIKGFSLASKLIEYID